MVSFSDSQNFRHEKSVPDTAAIFTDCLNRMIFIENKHISIVAQSKLFDYIMISCFIPIWHKISGIRIQVSQKHERIMFKQCYFET